MINRILEKIIDIKSLDPVSLLGIADCNLKLIKLEIPINIIARGNKIKITGNNDSPVIRLVETNTDNVAFSIVDDEGFYGVKLAIEDNLTTGRFVGHDYKAEFHRVLLEENLVEE